MKVAVALALIFLTPFTLAQSISSDSKPENCPAPPADLPITETLYETGTASSLLSQLLSGNEQDAIRDLRGTLVVNILDLNLRLKEGPCKSDPASIQRIYQMLRLVAAINQKFPIPELIGNKEAQGILERAIAENPKHYEQLLERSKKWDHGIR